MAEESSASETLPTVELKENAALKRTLLFGLALLPVLFLILTYIKMHAAWSQGSGKMVFLVGAGLLCYMTFKMVGQLSKSQAIKIRINSRDVVILRGPTVWGRGEWSETERFRMDGSVKLAAMRWNLFFNGCVIVKRRADAWYFSSSWFKGVNNAIQFFEDQKLKFEPLTRTELRRQKRLIAQAAAKAAKASK